MIEKGWTTNEIIKDSFHDTLSKDLTSWSSFVASYDQKNIVPSEAGIYFFWLKAKFNLSNEYKLFTDLIYIGSSDSSIRSRFIDHMKKPKFKKISKLYQADFMYSYVLLDPQNKDILDLEDICIRATGPKLNEKYVIQRESITS